MGNRLYHTLVNPNKLRHYGTQVQDNPISESSLYIATEYGEFSMDLSMEESILFNNTHTPSDKKLQKLPHINLGSPHPWDSMNFFPKFSQSLEEEVRGVQYLSSVDVSHP